MAELDAGPDDRSFSDKGWGPVLATRLSCTRQPFRRDLLDANGECRGRLEGMGICVSVGEPSQCDRMLPEEFEHCARLQSGRYLDDRWRADLARDLHDRSQPATDGWRRWTSLEVAWPGADDSLGLRRPSQQPATAIHRVYRYRPPAQRGRRDKVEARQHRLESGQAPRQLLRIGIRSGKRRSDLGSV